MSRNADITKHPVLDLLSDRSIPSGSPALVTDLIVADLHQWALFLKWGHPPIWISCSLQNVEATIEYISPPACEFLNVGLLMAGDGGIVSAGSPSAPVAKDAGEVVITHDSDTNGTKLVVKTKPTDLLASYTDLEYATFHKTDLWFGDSETALKKNRKLRIEANTNSAVGVGRTLRLAVPSGVKVYGILLEPIHRNL